MKTSSVENNGIKTITTVSDVTLDEIKESEFQKEGTLSAQIRQIITKESHYPSKKVTNNMQDNIFATKDFGFEEKVFDSKEERVAWLPVPVAASKEAVEAALKAHSAKGAVIYRVLSNQPILTDDQKYAVTIGNKTIDDFANSQAVRYPEGAVDRETGELVEGKLALDKAGNVQYRRTFFWKTTRADQDLRDATKEGYLSAELKAELVGASVMQGQTIV